MSYGKKYIKKVETTIFEDKISKTEIKTIIENISNTELKQRNKIKTQMCKRPILPNGKCTFGDSCFYAHHESELRTRKCFFGKMCKKAGCTFDHSDENSIPVLPPPSILKNENPCNKKRFHEEIEEECTNDLQDEIPCKKSKEFIIDLNDEEDEKEEDEEVSDKDCSDKEDSEGPRVLREEDKESSEESSEENSEEEDSDEVEMKDSEGPWVLREEDNVEELDEQLKQLALKETVKQQDMLHKLPHFRKREFATDKKWFNRYFNIDDRNVFINVYNSQKIDSVKPSFEELETKKTTVIILNHTEEEMEQINAFITLLKCKKASL